MTFSRGGLVVLPEKVLLAEDAPVSHEARFLSLEFDAALHALEAV